MKSVIILAVAVLAVAIASSIHNINLSAVQEREALAKFNQFKIDFEKEYATAEEEMLRYENFKASLIRSAHRNAKAISASYGINVFSDMSVEEFQSTMLMSKPIIPDTTTPRQVAKPTQTNIPAEFDWRPRGAVTPVKNQEQCGSCWAFSTTETIESMWILAGKGTNETVDLAPQQIVDCDTSDYGCEGGEPTTAYEYVISAGGMEPEKKYPYTGEQGTCKFVANDTVAHISNWQYACSWTEESTLQSNLVSWGPISICVDATFWHDYTGGVMSW